MGVTYVAVAPQHPVARKAAETNSELAQFIAEQNQTQGCRSGNGNHGKTRMDTGLKAIHPISGDSVPIYTANFVLMSYGSGGDGGPGP